MRYYFIAVGSIALVFLASYFFVMFLAGQTKGPNHLTRQEYLALFNSVVIATDCNGFKTSACAEEIRHLANVLAHEAEKAERTRRP